MPTMNSQFQFDVFLSYHSQDKPLVRLLAERLREAGLNIWFDDWQIKPGDDIYLAIEHGLEAARVQLLCLSPAALESNWVNLERSTVLFRDPSNAGRRFVPLLLADCELPDTLRRYKYVDLRGGVEAVFAEILTACREETSIAQSADGERTGATLAIEEMTLPSEPLAVFERTLEGHGGDCWVLGIAISPDSAWVVSGAGPLRESPEGNTVKIWSLENGNCQMTLLGHDRAVSSVAISPDGRHILSGSFDGAVRVWEASTGRELAKLEGHRDKVRSVQFLPDNVHALSGSLDRTLRLWNTVSGECRKVIGVGWGDSDSIFGVAVNREGTQALSGHRDGRIRLWSLISGECLARLEGHNEIVHSVQFAPDGYVAVSGSADKTIRIWDLASVKCIGVLEGHDKDVHSVALSSDGSVIISTGFIDGTVRLWDRKSGACLQVIKLEVKGISSPISCAFTPDGSRFLVGTVQGEILVYRYRGHRPNAIHELPTRYINAKVVLLGEGTVGKTSLAHRLIKDDYVISDRTHGMNVWPLSLPSPTNPDQSKTGEEREVLLWDLAGQEDYRLIHRLFLEQTALGLLLINPQKDDPFAEAGDWLKALQTAAANASTRHDPARLLVFSQVDVGEPKLSNAKIERFCQEQGFAGWLLTSAKNGRNCSDARNGGQASALKQLIADSVPWEQLPWTSTPKLLASLKNAVMSMRDTADIRLLRFSELAQRLEQALPGEKIGEPDVRTAVTLLANHGLAQPLKFGDLVLLRPDLLNGYAGAIIRAARAHTDEIGCVAEADIFSPDFDFTGVDRLLHRPDEELLLLALVQTFLDNSLCIAEDTPQGRHLVFPSQYRREKDLPRDPDIFVSYRFSGEWQTVWTTLVVRLWYSQEFGHRELWRNAAEFESVKKQILGLKIEKEGDGAATISLYFDHQLPDELKVIFIEYVHRHLDKYACEVVRKRRYVCQCGMPVKDMDAVQRRLAAGRDFITCQDCDAQVPFSDFIEQHLKSDPVAQRILNMEKVASRELDNQSQEQILIGHMMAIAGEASQIFRPTTMFDHGIDGEVEFKDNDGKASGQRIYIQLKSGNSYLRTRRKDGCEIFDVKEDRHLDYWVSQPVDVYLVIRQKDEIRGEENIRWMNVTRYLKNRQDKASRQIIFSGEKLDAGAVWRVRDGFFPPRAKSVGGIN